MYLAPVVNFQRIIYDDFSGPKLIVCNYAGGT